MIRCTHSLHGRLVMLVVAALVIAQGIALGLHVMDRDDYIRELNETIATRRIPAAVAVLNTLPADGRARLASALGTTWSRFHLSDDSSSVTEWSDAETLARPLRSALGSDRVRVGRQAEPSSGVPPARWSGETLTVAVQLDSGDWLVMERPLGHSLSHALGRVAFSILLSAVLVVTVVAWLAGRITRPLGALTEAAERFGRGDPVAPLPESGPEDVRRTVRAFNVMSDRLQRFITDRTRMLAAVSHDLRTPITALRLRSEMVDDAETRERMQRSLDEMQRMVEATLQFARAEAVQEPVRRLDLGELIERVCTDVADAGGEVACTAPAGVSVLARPTALARALRNLVENAVFYGGRAEVTLHDQGAGPVVRVEDPGPGIPEQERERVFDPFVRLESSRNSETGGIGLGLATARTTIHAHGGDIRLDQSALGGLRVEVVLPSA